MKQPPGSTQKQAISVQRRSFVANAQRLLPRKERSGPRETDMAPHFSAYRRRAA
jgi:hypothetical protein